MFGMDDTGVFSEIGKFCQNSVSLESTTATNAPGRVIDQQGSISVLKIDIEGAECEVLKSLPKSILRDIEVVYAEMDPSEPGFDEISLDGFELSKAGIVWRYARIDQKVSG
jgi:Methyltransferase FkbM domain